MPLLRVNPTRMELTKLKKRLKTARRGHRLLKEKRDELMKQFLERIRKNRDLRLHVETQLLEVHARFRIAAALLGPDVLTQSLMMPKQVTTVEVRQHNVMSVNIPEYTVKRLRPRDGDNFPYGFFMTNSDLDEAILSLSRLQEELIALAELEKSTQLIALEIEKTRRRVNALEYIVIPQLTETIHAIAMKLDENERGNIMRLMKVKDLLLEEAKQHDSDA